jgi:hypothetical protein
MNFYASMFIKKKLVYYRFRQEVARDKWVAGEKYQGREARVVMDLPPTVDEVIDVSVVITMSAPRKIQPTRYLVTVLPLCSLRGWREIIDNFANLHGSDARLQLSIEDNLIVGEIVL